MRRQRPACRIGTHVINPFNGDVVPIWIADYVLMNYGTGAVMGVPAHDERDFAFAKTFNLPITEVISPDGKPADELKEAYLEPGIMVNSGNFNGLESQAKKKIIDYAADNKLGVRAHPVSFARLADQPATLLGMSDSPGALRECGIVPFPMSNCPWCCRLKAWTFTGEGGSPLARMESFFQRQMPVVQAAKHAERQIRWILYLFQLVLLAISPMRRMPKRRFAQEKVDLSGCPSISMSAASSMRSCICFIPDSSPSAARYEIGELRLSLSPICLSQGMVTKFSPTSGRIEKMSKSRGNVVGTTDFFKRYGADAARLFTFFASPPEQELEWNEDGAVGQFRFLGRVWRFTVELVEQGIFTTSRIDKARTLSASKSFMKVSMSAGAPCTNLCTRPPRL